MSNSELDALRREIALKLVRMNIRRARMFRDHGLYGYARLALNEALDWRRTLREMTA